jgi:hypothetical protein
LRIPTHRHRLRPFDDGIDGPSPIIETYPFERDLPVDLPSQLGGDEIFTRNSTLRDLVPEWQGGVPIRALEDADWRDPGAFYVRVGTEDSLGSSLPPAANAAKVRVTPELSSQAKRDKFRPQIGAASF